MKKLVFDARVGAVYALPGEFDRATGAYLCHVVERNNGTFMVIGADDRPFAIASWSNPYKRFLVVE